MSESRHRPEQRHGDTTPTEAPRDSFIGALDPDRHTPDLLQIAHAVQDAYKEACCAADDEVTVGRYIRALVQLYPHVRFISRVASMGTKQRLVQIGTHRLRRHRHNITLSDSALALADLGNAPRLVHPLEITSGYQSVLEPEPPQTNDSMLGMDAPVLDQDRVIGVVAAEYPPGMVVPPNLRIALVMAANGLAAALSTARLRRQGTYLRAYVNKLVEHANIPVFVAGLDRTIRVTSSGVAQITGWAQNDLRGRDLLELVPEEDRVLLLSTFVAAAKGSNETPIEMSIECAHGAPARLSVRLAPVLDNDNSVVGVIGIGQDLTEVHRLKDQVLQVEKLASLGQLAAGIVHELNNPLTSIAVYGEYLLNKLQAMGAEQPDIDRMRRILSSAERILGFTKSLLSYARPSRETPELLSINEVLDESIKLCAHVIENADAEIKRDYRARLTHVRGVRGQLHQVFVNLITNACSATTKGAGLVIVRTEQQRDGAICVVVEDNGTGIASEQLAHVFEPFFSTKPQGQGTGLGLSIVHSIVEQHQGSIAIESLPGQGTQVRTIFPGMYA